MDAQYADQGQSLLVRRQVVRLILLVAIAVAAVIVTRAAATLDRTVNARDAAEWFVIGQRYFHEQRIDDAVSALRRATVRDRGNRQYGAALTRALAAAGRTSEARQLLLRLRESAPEDPEVNAQLARLAATRGDVSEALRYFHSAIYGVWADERSAARQELRLELIRFLVRHEQLGSAVAELLALSAGLPDQAAPHLETGRLFLGMGDPRHALAEFSIALRVAPDDPDGLAGAGESAYRLGDYAGALRYFRRAPRLPDRAENLSRVAALVLSHDPHAARLTQQERRRRVVAGAAQVRRRVDDCLTRLRAGPGPARSELEAVQAQIRAFESSLRARAARDSADVVDLGVELVYRAERAAAQACGEPAGLDSALLLIGQRYAGQER